MLMLINIIILWKQSLYVYKDISYNLSPYNYTESNDVFKLSQVKNKPDI